MKHKHKRTDWSKVPWTPFEEVEVPDTCWTPGNVPVAMARNSRYQVTIYSRHEESFGRIAHLSIKTHDRQAFHDWRDLQRIKNELCGPECDAVEIYPAESKLVDSSNQYHLFVFRDYTLPFGFQTRLVADGSWQGTKQRPFADRPVDCLSAEELGAAMDKITKDRGEV